ncbi:unnamed protein product [Camellia sinensis]
MVVRTKPAQFKFTHNNTCTTQTHPTMAAFLNLSTSFFPSPRHHLLPPRTTFLYTTPFSSLPHSFSSSPSRRPRFASTPILSSLKEDLGRVTKVWSDFSSLNYWVVRDYYRLVNSVNALEPHIQGLSDEQLTTKTIEFRHRLKHGETVADIQAEAYAVVREAARRKLGMRHFDVQIIGGAVLHDGSIAEMKTGEGKTLVSTLAAYLNALTGEGVHVVTVNDYLAQRDAEWMGRVHRFLGLSVGLIQVEQLVMRWPKPFNFAIVDEVDSVLIDEGRNPLLISGEASKDAARYPVAAKVAELLVRDLLKDNSVELTEEGIALAEMALETHDLWDENDPWTRFVMNALKAKEFYRRDVQYIVRNGKALIINERTFLLEQAIKISLVKNYNDADADADADEELTGRVEEKRRWSEGIHQAVEAKEGVKIEADSVVVAQITYQSLFKLYPKLSGMTGTAKTEEKEFLKMFQIPVIEVPTNLPNIRKDLPIQAFAVEEQYLKTARGKWEHVREEVESMFRQGRPVLVGTTSVENSEYLSSLLREQKVPHNVLNARPKYAAREAETVAQAGRKYAITISTNMAGRGTDIILGGNPKMLAKEIIEDSLLSFLTKEAPDFEVDGEPISQKVLSKIKVGPSSLGLLAKMALMAKYVCKSEGKSWTYQEAKSIISESVEMGQSTELQELEKLVNEQSESYPLGPSIGLAYLSVLKDCEKHCFSEGLEVKRLGGLHVIGTSLHESRRIDNQCRQGDPGSTRFMVSLQDEMFQKFNFDTEWAVKLISKITNDKDIPIEGDAIVKQLLALQINAEKYFFGIRKSLVEFDEVLENAHEISVLCDADIGLIIFSAKGKLFEYSTTSCMERILERYERYSYAERQLVAADIDSQVRWTLEHVKLQARLEVLDRTQRHFMGEDLDTLSVKELQSLEHQLDSALKHIRSRKNQLMNDSISELQTKDKIRVQRKHVYDLRQLILTGDSESCSQHIFHKSACIVSSFGKSVIGILEPRYMQAVVDEIIFGNVDPLKHPSKWNLGKLLKEFNGISGKILNEVALRESLTQLHELSSVSINDFHLPNLPSPPNAFRGIRRKSSSLKRWLAICSDDSAKDGKYRPTVNLLRKYLGDFIIASYLDVVQESGYDDAYMKEIERAVLVKTQDCFWRDHLVNMNRLSSAVNVRSFGHRNPLEEYKIDGCRFFISMLSATRRLTVESLLRYWSSPMESQELYVS